MSFLLPGTAKHLRNSRSIHSSLVSLSTAEVKPLKYHMLSILPKATHPGATASSQSDTGPMLMTETDHLLYKCGFKTTGHSGQSHNFVTLNMKSNAMVG
jgi:hypothetical protein